MKDNSLLTHAVIFYKLIHISRNRYLSNKHTDNQPTDPTHQCYWTHGKHSYIDLYHHVFDHITNEYTGTKVTVYVILKDLCMIAKSLYLPTTSYQLHNPYTYQLNLILIPNPYQLNPYMYLSTSCSTWFILFNNFDSSDNFNIKGILIYVATNYPTF